MSNHPQPTSRDPMDSVSDLPQGGWVVVVAGAADRLVALSLVLEAVGIDHWLDEEGQVLLVARDDAASARFHLDQYVLENRDWPPPRAPLPPLSSQLQPTVPAMLLLAVFFLHTGPWSSATPWFKEGAMDSVALLQRGEWWRLITALTLHADWAHLLGNCLLGGTIVHWLGRTIGYGQAWLLLIAGGTGGNLGNVAFRHQPHLSVGFSTSVFAAIGLLTGLELARNAGHSRRALLLPLGAGAGLLALLGSEGVRVDLGAHLAGFSCGITIGFLGRKIGLIKRLQHPDLQGFLFFLALTLVVLAWTRALA